MVLSSWNFPFHFSFCVPLLFNNMPFLEVLFPFHCSFFNQGEMYWCSVLWDQSLYPQSNVEVDSSCGFAVVSWFWPDVLQRECSSSSASTFLQQWWMTVMMQILIQKHTGCIQNHILSRSAALDQTIRSILADTEKLWKYYPLFSLPSPWQSILKIDNFHPRIFIRGKCKRIRHLPT